jgi:TetR/AcrR family transcriptional repressor of mexJK operon
MFLQEGFEGTSMEAVAARLGIPKRTLYRRFADKGKLLNAVLVERVNAWSSITSQQNARLTGDLSQRLKQYVTTMLVWASRAEVRAFTKLFATAEGISGQSKDRFGFYGRAQMVELIAHDIAEFGPTQGIHAREPLRVAHVLMALLSGWLDFRRNDAPIADGAAAEEAGMLVDVLLRGTKAW